MLTHNNEDVKDKNNVVDKLSHFIVNVGSELAVNIDKINNSSIYEYHDHPITHSMFLNDTNQSDIGSGQ